LERIFPITNDTSIKDDPIKNKFYDPIETSEFFLKIIFWVTVLCSFAIPLCNKASSPNLYNSLQIIFCVFVFLLFVLDMFVSYYLKPRANDMRLKDFLSHASGIDLNHNKTHNYYNNNEIESTRKLAAQLLENTLHSKSTALGMTRKSRWMTLIYIVVFIIIMINRNTDLEIISSAAQVVFGLQLITSFIRIEWMRSRFEQVYDDIST